MSTDQRAYADLVDARGAAPATGRDRLLDVVKATAIVRVVLWHTWSWWWLSWIPAMPAMFFASGALLEGSLERRGWWSTVRQRAVRLLIPFWAYGVACWTVMVAGGWRPSAEDAIGWVIPLVDPVGSASMSALWIPLWYVRAYLWFVLAAGVFRFLLRRFGVGAVVGAGALTVGAWAWGRGGGTMPAEIGDLLTYSTFVLAGMRYRTNGPPSRPVALLLAASGAVAAIWWWSRFGPADGIVNRSYPLTALVGMAGVGLFLAFRDRLVGVRGRVGRLIELIGRRALTIYLWQGFGLLAAHHLVSGRLDPGPLHAVASLAIVAAVIISAVVVAGPIEDLAAGRATPSRTLVRSSFAVPGLAVLLVAVLLPSAPLGESAGPALLSGKAVVTRAEAISDALDQPVSSESSPLPPGAHFRSPAEVFDAWAARHAAVMERIGFTSLDAAMVDARGDLLELSWRAGEPATLSPFDDGAPHRGERMAWWSMTKAATAIWFMRSVEAGVVAIDDPLARWVPDSPHGDRITLEQLARHTAGVPSDFDGDLFTAAPDRSLGEFKERPELAFEPGTSFEYSRLGYFLLALALERATGTSWRSAMEDLAAQAQVTLRFDEDDTPADRVTDPDGLGYRGGLWASGGILSELTDGARFFHWVFTDGLGPDARDTMADFSADPDRWYYGLGLMPLCPCREEGDRVRATRFGLDSAPGFFVFDQVNGATVMAAPNTWFESDGPAVEFYELQSELLDSLS